MGFRPYRVLLFVLKSPAGFLGFCTYISPTSSFLDGSMVSAASVCQQRHWLSLGDIDISLIIITNTDSALILVDSGTLCSKSANLSRIVLLMNFQLEVMHLKSGFLLYHPHQNLDILLGSHLAGSTMNAFTINHGTVVNCTLGNLKIHTWKNLSYNSSILETLEISLGALRVLACSSNHIRISSLRKGQSPNLSRYGAPSSNKSARVQVAATGNQIRFETPLVESEEDTGKSVRTCDFVCSLEYWHVLKSVLLRIVLNVSFAVNMCKKIGILF
ncbi:hypothetical protein Tco_0532265 [Tanacetum coccineum]